MVPVRKLYEQFMSSLGSSFLLELTNEEIEKELHIWLIRALAKFKYPRVSLDITKGQNTDEQWYFVNEVTQKEFEVLLAYMKVYWFEYILANEKRFLLYYEDANLRLPSQGAIMTQLNRTFENATRAAKQAQTDYYKEQDGAPQVGEIWNT